MKIEQANIFYNYAIGHSSSEIDLIETSKTLIGSGLTNAIFFSDLKYIYKDRSNRVHIERVQPKGRQWDSSWEIEFDTNLSRDLASELTHSLELAFFEKKFKGDDTSAVSYLRAALPPFVLEDEEFELPIYPWVKIFSDGITLLSFQFDATWSNINQEDFLTIYVNLFKRYFKTIWLDDRIQRLDAEHILPFAFDDEFQFAGKALGGRKAKKLIKKMRTQSKSFLNTELSKEGRKFNLSNRTWVLHKVAGADENPTWESNLELCRSQYTNAINQIIVPSQRRKVRCKTSIWNGRPSISLMRFGDQPSSKDELFKNFGCYLSKLLGRSIDITDCTLRKRNSNHTYSVIV